MPELPAVPDVGFDDAISNEDLHRLLADVDPQRAAELHPNDRRKIIRSLQGRNIVLRFLGIVLQIGV